MSPPQKQTNIPSEISFVDLVLIVLINWGKNEMVVSVPAITPINVTKLISDIFFVFRNIVVKCFLNFPSKY